MNAPAGLMSSILTVGWYVFSSFFVIILLYYYYGALLFSPPRVASLPWVGEAIFGTLGPQVAARGVSHGLMRPGDPTGQLLIEAASYQAYHNPGFNHAYLSCIRHFPFTTLSSKYLWVGGHSPKIPVLLVWVGVSAYFFFVVVFFSDSHWWFLAQGEDDNVVPYSLHTKVFELIPHTMLVTIPRGGHNALIEEVPYIVPKILDFLQ